MVLALLSFRRSGYTETFLPGRQTMLATIDRPTETKTSSLPGLTFDEENRVINATVTISPGDELGKYHHHVPAMSAAGLTGSLWTVIWTLEPSAGLSATFKDPGIVIPKPGTSVPEGVKNRNSMGIFHSGSPETPPAQWQFTFTNEVTDVNVIRYDIDLDVQDSGGNPLAPHGLVIDPTIAVVREPIDG
jgi:hypothetical protein